MVTEENEGGRLFRYPVSVNHPNTDMEKPAAFVCLCHPPKNIKI